MLAYLLGEEEKGAGEPDEEKSRIDHPLASEALKGLVGRESTSAVGYFVEEADMYLTYSNPGNSGS